MQYGGIKIGDLFADTFKHDRSTPIKFVPLKNLGICNNSMNLQQNYIIYIHDIQLH